MNALRRTVRWALASLVPGELVLVLCLASGAGIPEPVMLAVEVAVLLVTAALVTLLAADYRRHRGAGLAPRAAGLEAVRDSVPAAVRKLTVHEVKLFTATLRWLARRPKHGVGPGDTAAAYASGQAFTFYGFFFVSVIETVALALVIPWPVVHAVVLVLDIWGIYFILALQAACVVRPHVVGADGSLRVRYGVLLDIPVPAELIANARLDRRFPDGGGLLRLADDGTADLAVGGQTTVTVELTEPVSFVRPLGKRAEVRVLRFYADDPKPVVAALRRACAAREEERGEERERAGERAPLPAQGAGSKRTGDTPGSAAVSRTRTRWPSGKGSPGAGQAPTPASAAATAATGSAESAGGALSAGAAGGAESAGGPPPADAAPSAVAGCFAPSAPSAPSVSDDVDESSESTRPMTAGS